MASTLVDRVKVTVISSGAVPFVMGGPMRAYRGTEALVNGLTYNYAVEFGPLFEVGTGQYVAATQTLTRTPLRSSSGGALVEFPTGASLAFTAIADNFAKVVGLTQAEYDALGAPDGGTLYAIIDV